MCSTPWVLIASGHHSSPNLPEFEGEFTGEIITEELNERTRLRLTIHSNQIGENQSNQPVYKTLIPLNRTDTGLYYNWNKKITLPKGLYYYMYTIDKHETPDFCGKFVINDER